MCSSADSTGQQPPLCREINTHTEMELLPGQRGGRGSPNGVELLTKGAPQPETGPECTASLFSNFLPSGTFQHLMLTDATEGSYITKYIHSSTVPMIHSLYFDIIRSWKSFFCTRLALYTTGLTSPGLY
ncbi:hypothetical protein EXN66_Car004021 [Channa argus]|uniref:Uncharacterized protein n=1 Tax=Channa argus TaxID=215402 RepID=A0A6G1PDR1_CHAAH|nr:hypothetical protein EXN66_Car004021 [Channa argus]